MANFLFHFGKLDDIPGNITEQGHFLRHPMQAAARLAHGGQGLEVDKLNRAAVEFHWNTCVDKMIKDAKGAPSLTEILIDSYEVGMQNWTEGFAKEFRKRRGYDLIPMMAALTGRIVNNTETTERIFWDLRVTVAE